MTHDGLKAIAVADIEKYNAQYRYCCAKHRLFEHVFEGKSTFRGRMRYVIGYNWTPAYGRYEGRYKQKVIAYGATREKAVAKLLWQIAREGAL